MTLAVETIISQHHKAEAVAEAKYVRGDDSDYFVHSLSETLHIAFVLSTMRCDGTDTVHEVLIARKHSTFKMAVAHVDVQYHLDTCESDALLRAMSQAEAYC